jgi:Zn-dependent oligopeptidase
MVATETLTENPLLKQENLPKFESIQPSDLTPAVSELLSKLEQVSISGHFFLYPSTTTRLI